MDTTTQDIAQEAIEHEGVASWFPGFDPETHWNLDHRLAAKELAGWMDAHPNAWSPGTANSPWEFRGGDVWHDHAESVLDRYAE